MSVFPSLTEENRSKVVILLWGAKHDRKVRVMLEASSLFGKQEVGFHFLFLISGTVI